jgi:hypothetical protein
MSEPIGLLEAVDDRNLLGAGVEPWPMQRELLGSLEAGGSLHVWALGRRSGKTLTGAIAGVHNALLRPDLDGLVRRRERRYVVSIANSLRQARLFVSSALSIVEASPLLQRQVESSSLDEVVFRNGVTLAAFPCTSRGVRGWPISLLFLDEFAHFYDETEGPAAAERVFAAASPSVAQFGGLGRVVASSTPFGSDGLFADLFQRVTRGELEDAVAHHATSAEANPTLSAEWLGQQRLVLGEEFRSEYEADFVAGGSAFFDEESIRAAVVERDELPGDALVRGWVAGLDPAFSSDPFGVAIVGEDMAQLGRLVVGAVRAWKPSRKRVSLDEGRRVEDEVLAEVAELCRRYGARAVTDQHRAAGVVDRLRRLGVSVRSEAMTAESKTAIFRELRARLNAREIELYPHPQLLAELRRVRSRFTAQKAQVWIPRTGGSHGDLAQALALAVWEARRVRGDTGTRAGVETELSERGSRAHPQRVVRAGLDLEAERDALGDLWRGGHA